MTDFVLSLVRTVVPIGVGALISWLALRGVAVEESAQAALVSALTALITAGYYAGARVLELRWPWFGYLLGTKAEPTYNRKH
ncbi:hypothetical protein RDI86_02330 [Cellulosimicrobium sp. XJ-DQ-B-000]|uniref:hypothetical protein n=1 Tax=Cellulosimicrobium sp. XJ-DQ-B-000 TaxID=3072182 RepID=UPI002808BED1|nr:hypothetical protein [Cellulosimicrobium sp. XJ-DQ-B-000]MDQ8040679.1 hypothetical protein [Cellulosimicrobium sp. XJ-DQ-B-000]